MGVEVFSGSGNVVPFVRREQIDRGDRGDGQLEHRGQREQRARRSRDVLLDLHIQVQEIDDSLEEPMDERPWWGLWREVDAETAVFIAEQLTHAGVVSAAALDGLVDPAVERAIEACREAVSSWAELGKARERAAMPGNAGIAWFADQVELLWAQTVELVAEAQSRCDEVRGIERAVGFARRGEVWVPYRGDEGAQWLLDAEAASERGKARALARSL
jgi:hypothetical protein